MVDRPAEHAPTLPAGSPPAAGRLAAGHAAGEYIVEGLLGAGAMGEVYAGRHPVIGKRVAIKVLRDAGSSEAAERFVREARAACAVEHPNVVDVFAFGRLDDGRPYLVMELVEGHTLRRALDGGPLPPSDALAILAAIADALDTAHARGVVHRDLKPDNIMLAGEARRVLVLDFGLAKLVQRTERGDAAAPGTLTGQGTWLGTPGYMAPEQWSADGAVPASDRYALGVIAFELLAGVPPFTAASVPAMMEQHFRAAVPSIAQRSHQAAALPAAVDDVLRRALAKDPDQRFASARELVAALEAALGTGAGPLRATPRPASARALRMPAIAGLAVLGVGAAAAIGLRRGASGDDPAPAAAPPGHQLVVRITSSPSGAQVVANGEPKSATPVAIFATPGQRVELAVSLPGYATEHRAIVASTSDDAEAFTLAPVTGFAGVWRLPGGELRELEPQGDRVAAYKRDAVASGPRTLYKIYAFVPAERGVGFAADDEIVDERAPGEPSCHVPVHVEYRYDPEHDALELRRDKLAVEFVAGKCVVQSRSAEPAALERVDGAHEAHEVLAPAGGPPQAPVPKPPPPQRKAAAAKKAAKQAPNPPFDAVGKAPPSPFTKTKANPTDNVFQNDQQQAANPPPQPPPQAKQRAQPQPPIQAPSQAQGR